MSVTEEATTQDATSEAADASEFVLTLTERAIAKVLEIRSSEPEPELMGLRVGIVGASGTDYQYDLSLELLSEAVEDDSVSHQGGLAVLVPADSITNLSGATLDLPANAAQGGLVIRNPNKPNPLAGIDLSAVGDLADKVNVLLEKSVNPSLAAHGGFATLVGVDEAAGNVYLTMGGGCQGCSMSRMTLTQGIRQTIIEALPEVKEVLDVTDHSAGESPFYQQ